MQIKRIQWDFDAWEGYCEWQQNDVIDRLLFEGLNDNGTSADCIIVLGSIKAARYRVPVAAEAFFQGGLKR